MSVNKRFSEPGFGAATKETSFKIVGDRFFIHGCDSDLGGEGGAGGVTVIPATGEKKISGGPS